MNNAFELIHENNMMQYFTRNDYRKAFEDYAVFCKPFFDALPTEEEELDRIADDSFAQLDACWKAQLFFRRNGVRSNDRIMLATFFSPAAREHSENAFAFAEKLREKWISAYPAEPFESADYATILKGFERTTLLGFKINK